MDTLSKEEFTIFLFNCAKIKIFLTQSTNPDNKKFLDVLNNTLDYTEFMIRELYNTDTDEV
jgi:hypothetical protein